MGTFGPYSVEPGWLVRWPKLAAELIRRWPWAVAATTAVFGLVLLVPQSLLGPGVSVLELAWVMALARALDRGGGGWLYFKMTLQDVMRLTRDYLLILILVGMTVLYLRLHATHALGAIHQASDNWPAWVDVIWNNADLDSMATAFAIMPLAQFITMSIGYGGFIVVNSQAMMAIVRNPVPLLFMTLFMILTESVTARSIKTMGSLNYAIGFSLVLVVINVLMGFVWYVAAREVFDGDRDNTRARAHGTRHHPVTNAA